MSLTVLSVAYPLAHVGPDAVGGAEQVLHALDRALHRAGHRSIVIACEGSKTAGELVTIALPRGRFDEQARRATQARVRTALDSVLRGVRVDLVHMHGVDFEQYLPEPGPPVLVTLHLPLDWYPEAALRPARPRTYLHCVSASQRALAGEALPLLPDIANGVCLERFGPRPDKASYALVLGRVCREKGIHLALDAAVRADLPMLIAGQVFAYPEHERYFRDEVLPRLDQARRFVGPVGLREKSALLARARCLVVASVVQETSSLSAMEALASGTPVIAFRIGALSHIVEHGLTGLLVDTVDELAEALAKVRSLRSVDCRRAAERRFSARASLRRYMAVYAELAHRRP